MDERGAVKIVAKAAPWLAPIPSGFFVARSSMINLSLPLPVAIVAGAMIETLGIAAVFVALWLYDYNGHKRKTDPRAPTWIAVVLAVVYLLATVGLVVILEVAPVLAIYAPALFPVLAVVGAGNLAIIADQERRESAIRTQKAEARAARSGRSKSRSGSRQDKPVRTGQSGSRSRRSGSGLDGPVVDGLIRIYSEDPTRRAGDVAGDLGIGRSTVYDYLGRLEAAGRISRNGGGVQVEQVDHGA